MVNTEWFCNDCAKHDPKGFSDECVRCMESHVWTKENPPRFFVSKAPPSPTLSTATNRELAEAFAERFGFRLKKIYPDESAMVDEKNQTCIFLDNKLGPWQDSLIGPEGE